MELLVWQDFPESMMKSIGLPMYFLVRLWVISLLKLSLGCITIKKASILQFIQGLIAVVEVLCYLKIFEDYLLIFCPKWKFLAKNFSVMSHIDREIRIEEYFLYGLRQRECRSVPQQFFCEFFSSCWGTYSFRISRFNNYYWFLFVFIGFYWFLLISFDLIRFLLISLDLNLFSLISIGFCWFVWCLLISVGSQWFLWIL